MVLLKSLDELNFNTNKEKYKYKEIDFLCNIKPAKTIVVIFHGIGHHTIYPIFRGYNYNFTDSIVLSISDPLINIYKGLKIGWYLDTKKHKFQADMLDIIKHIKTKCNAQNIIFSSNCSGALIAVKFACMLKEYCLIANPHTILKSDDCLDYLHWTDESLSHGYRMPLNSDNKKVKILNQFLKENNDEIDRETLDSRVFLRKYGIPKKLICYTHTNDYTKEWILKMEKIYKDKNCTDKIRIILNEEACKSPHHSPFKSGNNLSLSIQKLISEICSN